jgi:hypothetical protein
LLIKRGEADRGVQALRAALVEHSNAKGKLHAAILTAILAEGLGGSGQVAVALAVIDEALVRAAGSGFRLCTAS